MKFGSTWIGAVLAGAMLAGCATPPFAPAPESAFGSPPRDPEAGARSYFDRILKDPVSARYQVGSPRKMECLIDQKVWAGWAVDVLVNAKNSYGAYTGDEMHRLFFEGDTVVRARNEVNSTMDMAYRTCREPGSTIG